MSENNTERQCVHVSDGEHTFGDGAVVIAEGEAVVTATAGARVDAWDNSTVEALPGSNVVVFSSGVTVREHKGAKVKNRGHGTVSPVES